MEKLNYNVNSDVLYAFEIATLIAETLYDDTIRSAYVMMGLLHLNDTLVNDFIFEQYGVEVYIPQTLREYLNNKDYLVGILGQGVVEEIEKNINELENTISNDTKDDISDEDTFSNTREGLRNEMFKTLEELARKNLEIEIANNTVPSVEPNHSYNLEMAIEDAAIRCKGKVIDASNFIYSLLLNGDSSAYKFMEDVISSLPESNLTIQDIIDYIEQNTDIYMLAEENDIIEIPKSLESCCSVFNEKFVKGQLNEIVGRDKQKKALWNIFSKRDKKNAILVGAAGSGKTAIVESLTQDIVNDTCPERFRNYNVIEFSTAAAVAGTKYRGEFEAKVIALKKFIEKTPNVILFIDEIHSIVGVGTSSEDSNDLSGALKSTLARGDAIVIGTTTYAEYENSIAKDIALRRRFQIVDVNEPKYDEIKDMIGLKLKKLKEFHKVEISDNMLKYAITVAYCLNTEICNPDKTLTLLDSAMAIAENLGDKKITKRHIDDVYYENFEKFNNMSLTVKKTTAMHEAGHYVVWRILSKNNATSKEIVAVSIIPGMGFLGANIYEINDSLSYEDNYNYFTSEICCLLAGRIASGVESSGDTNDLERACELANKMVTDFGMSEKYKNLSFKYNNTQSIYINENLSKDINDIVKKIIDDCYKRTTELLKEHSKLLESVTQKLLSKGILDKRDLEGIYRSYLKG